MAGRLRGRGQGTFRGRRAPKRAGSETSLRSAACAHVCLCVRSVHVCACVRDDNRGSGIQIDYTPPHTHRQAHAQTHRHTHRHTRACAHRLTHTRTYAQTHTRTHTDIHRRMHTQTHARTHARAIAQSQPPWARPRQRSAPPPPSPPPSFRGTRGPPSRHPVSRLASSGADLARTPSRPLPGRPVGQNEVRRRTRGPIADPSLTERRSGHRSAPASLATQQAAPWGRSPPPSGRRTVWRSLGGCETPARATRLRDTRARTWPAATQGGGRSAAQRCDAGKVRAPSATPPVTLQADTQHHTERLFSVCIFKIPIFRKFCYSALFFS